MKIKLIWANHEINDSWEKAASVTNFYSTKVIIIVVNMSEPKKIVSRVEL
jgi:ABC-type sulfate transport system substrate-binding protein